MKKKPKKTIKRKKNRRKKKEKRKKKDLTHQEPSTSFPITDAL